MRIKLFMPGVSMLARYKKNVKNCVILVLFYD